MDYCIYVKAITMFIANNQFREDLPQYGNMKTEYLNIPTTDTLEIVKAAMSSLKKIYLDDIYYKRSIIIFSEISKADSIEQYLFDAIPNSPERTALMKFIDNINQSYDVNKICISTVNEGEQS